MGQYHTHPARSSQISLFEVGSLPAQCMQIAVKDSDRMLDAMPAAASHRGRETPSEPKMLVPTTMVATRPVTA